MQTEKSSPSMFAANRVNNGQSHSLDVILIITFLLDIARHVINFEFCADLKAHNQNKLFYVYLQSLCAGGEQRQDDQPH